MSTQPCIEITYAVMEMGQLLELTTT